MVNRLPHVVKYTLKTPTAGISKNSDGDIIAPATTDILKEFPCRVQPNTSGAAIIKEEDGQRIEFKAVLFLNQSAEKIPFGQKIEVFEKGQLILSGTVKRFHRGQLQVRVWI
jgi:hypothetical protein